MQPDDALFDELDLGEFTVSNRMVMAPLTRNRAGEGNVPTPMNATYYRQRASTGLIVTEATQVSPMGQGYPRTPGIHNDAQVEGWRTVTDAVHAEGGRIFLQLWHVGRISHSEYHDGDRPVAPSAVKPDGTVLTPDLREVPFETPRKLRTGEVSDVVGEYREGARRAKEVGFDGVEIHAANGYLIDQFLRSGTNNRSDRYGGSLEDRTRFLEEVTDAVTGVWSPARVGLRLSPLSEFNDMYDENPEETFRRVARLASARNLTYVHLVEPDAPKPPVRDEGKVGRVFSTIRENLKTVLVANGNYDRERAEEALESGYADLISFGRALLANPDLPRRLRERLPVNRPDESTFYNGDEEGYTDYPTWGEIESGNADVETLDSLSELEPRGA